MPHDQNMFGAILEYPGQRNVVKSFRIFSLLLHNSKIVVYKLAAE